MTLAKALANGVPIGAMLCREEAASVLTAGSHGSTFGGTPFVTSVALATLNTMIGEKLPERAARLGRDLIGIELGKPAAPIMDACRDSGLLVLTAGEKVLRLAPPLVAGPSDISRALEIVKDVLGKAAG